VSASADGSARLWDISTGRWRTLGTHRREVNRIAFAHEGAVATASDDGTVALWDREGNRRWRTSLLLRSGVVLDHRGWRSLAGGSKPPEGLARAMVGQQIRTGSSHSAGDLVCLLTQGGRLIAWDAGRDEPIAEAVLEGAEKVWATPHGCVAGSPDGAALLDENGLRTLGVPPLRAVVADGERLVLGSADAARVLAADDFQEGARLSVRPGLTALGLAGGVTLAGYADGQVERLHPAGDGAVGFDGMPWSEVTALAAGPFGTLAIGFADGVIGLWRLDTGERLHHVRLHGAVTHLVAARGHLYAATELGASLSWDLRRIEEDHCDLMRAIWDEVPAIWTQGRAAIEPVPPEHRCAR
jgi:hypothetical protein